MQSGLRGPWSWHGSALVVTFLSFPNLCSLLRRLSPRQISIPDSKQGTRKKRRAWLREEESQPQYGLSYWTGPLRLTSFSMEHGPKRFGARYAHDQSQPMQVPHQVLKHRFTRFVAQRGMMTATLACHDSWGKGANKLLSMLLGRIAICCRNGRAQKQLIMAMAQTCVRVMHESQ